MKRLLFLILILLFALPCYAMSPVFSVGPTAASGALTGACTDSTHGESGTTYLLCEDFDGAVGCKAGSAPSNCRTQFTVEPGYAWGDFAYTTAKIEGTYSYYAAVADFFTYSATFAATSPFYLFFKMNIPAYIGDFDTDYFPILSTTDATDPRIYLAGTSGNYSIQVAGCNATTPSVYNLSYAQVYNVWVEYVKGTGVNASLKVFISTDATKGNSDNEYTDGDCQNGVTGLIFGVSRNFTNVGVVIDHIRIGSTQMTGVPD
jgi:hypothetical protein